MLGDQQCAEEGMKPSASVTNRHHILCNEHAVIKCLYFSLSCLTISWIKRIYMYVTKLVLLHHCGEIMT